MYDLCEVDVNVFDVYLSCVCECFDYVVYVFDCWLVL